MHNEIITKSIKPEEQIDKDALDLLRVQHLLHLYLTHPYGKVVISFINMPMLPAEFVCVLCSCMTTNTVLYVMYIVPSLINKNKNPNVVM